jgi:nitroreductase
MVASELLNLRSSTPSRLLKAPGPDAAQLNDLLMQAMRVPDHGKLAPWRFIVVQNQARQRLSELLVATRQVIDPNAGAEALAKDAQRFLHAPVIVVVVAILTAAHKIPEIEQAASAAAVCMQLLNAAFAAGFGAQWLTGWAAYDAHIANALGLRNGEQISGFIHIGSTDAAAIERQRPALRDKISHF